MRVSQEILALLRIVSTGSQFYIRIQGLEDDKRFPNGIALSTFLNTLTEAEQFRIDVAKYLYFLKRPVNKQNHQEETKIKYWDEQFSDIVNLCKWLTDEMLADNDIYDFIGNALKYHIIPRYLIRENINTVDEDTYISIAPIIVPLLKQHCINFIKLSNRHAPIFEINIRGAKSKYYDCKVCGYHNYHFSKHEATQEHSKYCKNIIPLKEKLKALIK
jgi:hypothetical protein